MATTGWEMLPEATKALSAPLTKLVEVIAAGCGRLYAPTDIKRTATAQGEALVIMEEARARASEVAVRAAQRVLDVETRRQENIEAITYAAQQQLPSEVSSAPVEPDWAARFFREAQDISNEQMRQLWGKLLAGEVAKPGSFSPRTLRVVADLTQKEAYTFGVVCSLIAKVHGSGLFTFLADLGAPTVKAKGVGLDEFLALQAAGLLTFDSLGGTSISYNKSDSPINVLIERPGDMLLVATPPEQVEAHLSVGLVDFTPAGRELFSVADWTAYPEHDKAIVKHVSGQGWSVQRRRIVGREGAKLLHEPWPDEPPTPLSS